MQVERKSSMSQLYDETLKALCKWLPSVVSLITPDTCMQQADRAAKYVLSLLYNLSFCPSTTLLFADTLLRSRQTTLTNSVQFPVDFEGRKNSTKSHSSSSSSFFLLSYYSFHGSSSLTPLLSFPSSPSLLAPSRTQISR